MISLITLVFAAVAVNGAILPFHPTVYTGLPGAVHAVGAKTYTVHPEIKAAVGAPTLFHSTISAAPIPIATQYAAVAAPVAVAAPTQYAAVSAPVAVAAPTQYAAVAAPAVPVSPVQSQFHSQDELGGYHFGHSGGPSSRNEIRDHFGNVRGSYNYIDSEGKIQTTHYSAGPAGFQVAATNLPVAPEAIPAALPVAVSDTPAVAEAKLAFKAAFDKAAAPVVAEPVAAEPVAAEPAAVEPAAIPARKKRSTTPVVAVHTPVHAPFHYPLHFRSALATPYAYTGLPVATTYTAAGPGTFLRNAELLRVTNNPNHAVSYRVY